MQVIQNLPKLGARFEGGAQALFSLVPDPNVNTYSDLRLESTYPGLGDTSVAQLQIGGSGEVNVRGIVQPGVSFTLFENGVQVYPPV